jgi:hypothetical protein
MTEATGAFAFQYSHSFFTILCYHQHRRMHLRF